MLAAVATQGRSPGESSVADAMLRQAEDALDKADRTDPGVVWHTSGQATRVSDYIIDPGYGFKEYGLLGDFCLLLSGRLLDHLQLNRKLYFRMKLNRCLVGSDLLDRAVRKEDFRPVNRDAGLTQGI